jgi:putative ABC transport system permease protein
MLNGFFVRVRALVRPARIEREIDEELQVHLESRIGQLVAQGMRRDEARASARRELGDLTSIKEESREAFGVRFIGAGVHDDLKAAVRSLRSSKTFTAVALTVLALGIGATTAIFSVVDAVVLRGLPFDEQDRLVAVGERRPPGPRDLNRDPQALSIVAPQNYMDWASQQRVFESMAAVAFSALTLREPGAEPEELKALRATAGFFDVLRTRPALGRVFTVENEIDGRHRVAVIGDSLWRRRFGGDPELVGRTIVLGDSSYEVVGVMPPDLTYPVGDVRPTDVWIPYVVPSNERIRIRGQYRRDLQSIARLKPGVSIEQAQAQMDQVAAAIEQANPVWNEGHKVGVRPLHDHVVGASTKSWLLMLLGAVAIVLLIACANVANLMLARASAREREVAVRAALGAGRWRLLRQLMVESLVLSIAGTVLATGLAWWAVQILRSAMPEGVPRVTAIALDLRVLVAAAGLSLATGLLFGIVPALQLSKPDLTTSLKDGTRGASAGRGPQRMRGALIVAEVALAVVLLVGAALFIGSFIALMRIDPGFNPERVLTARVSPRAEPGRTASDSAAALAQIVERLSQTPGVVHAAMIAGGIPLSGGMFTTQLEVPGRTIENDDGISIRFVTPDYQLALRIPLRSGRLLDVTDRAGGTNVALINESAARKYFPGENPIGRSARINGESRTVVGVVGDVHQSSLESGPRAEAYVPISQSLNLHYALASAEMVIQTSADPYGVLPAVKSAVLAVMPDVPLRNVRTMEELFSRQIAQRRLNMLLLGLFGLLGLVISTVGIYGVMAYVVAHRTREIGVRMALGATRSTVIGMVLRHACVLVAAGLIMGGIGAWYLSATAKTFVFGLESNDPRAFVAALISLSLAAFVASAIPARRAASVDPIVALRAE